MTSAAREVLKDCELALEMLESETDVRRWRVHWASAVALIRAVGHVLHKVDAKDGVLRPIVKQSYERWKQGAGKDEIFCEFIEAERNNILKEYRFNLHPLDEVDVAVEVTLQNPETKELSKSVEVFPIGDNIYRPMLGSYCEGDDARDVYKEAIGWWNQELSAIEKEAERISRSKR